jgi:hypothetical protein
MKLCKFCDSPFEVSKDRQIFCCHRCQAKFAIRIADKKKKPRPKTGKDFICKVCNKSFYVPGWRMRRGDAQYCSRSCLAKIHLAQFANNRFQPIGKPHHQYKYINIDGKRIREHRWIMQQHLRRKLERWEHVHHINGDSFDNRLENLVVLSNSEHQRIEHLERKKIISSS